jgi:hypothetical protein
MNVLGETHTEVSMKEVAPAVGCTNFIYEEFASDDLSGTPNLQSTYQKANADSAKGLGIGTKDLQKHGAESLFPKLGVVFIKLLHYLSDPTIFAHLAKGKPGTTKESEELEAEHYLGRLFQRGLIMGWAYGQDMKKESLSKKKSSAPAQTQAAALASVVTKVEGELNPFISKLSPDGYLGDSLQVIQDGNLFDPLKQFVDATIALITEMGAEASSSETGFSESEQAELASDTTTNDRKYDLLWQWRNTSFASRVNEAAKGGVRYAGMGSSHLAALADSLPANSQGYYMDGADLDAFKLKTAELKSHAEAKETNSKKQAKEPAAQE